MTTLIPFAVIIVLVSVQASSITGLKKELEEASENVKELLILEESDGITTYDVENICAIVGALNQKERMETIGKLLQFPSSFQDLTACSGSTCSVCVLGSACVEITYRESTRDFNICVKFAGIRLLCKALAVPERDLCLEIFGFKFCAGLHEVQIKEGKVCFVLKLVLVGITVNIPRICLSL